jgi:hypothetical protein
MSGLLSAGILSRMPSLLLSSFGKRDSLPCNACTKKLDVSREYPMRAATYMPNTGMRITRASARVGSDKRAAAHSLRSSLPVELALSLVVHCWNSRK